MSIEAEVKRIQSNISAAYEIVSGMGATLPQDKTSENLANTISTIPYGCNTYFTQETRIGTWIDGKPIYRRAYQATSPSSHTTGTTIVSKASFPTNIQQIIKLYGISKQSLGTYICIPSHYSSEDYVTIYAYHGERIDMVAEGVNNYSCPVIIIIEYTKTTDPAADSLTASSQIDVLLPEIQFEASAPSVSVELPKTDIVASSGEEVE